MNICPQEKKHTHYTIGEAKAHLKSLKEKDNNYMGEVYGCIYCRGWHIGRKKLNDKTSNSGN